MNTHVLVSQYTFPIWRGLDNWRKYFYRNLLSLMWIGLVKATADTPPTVETYAADKGLLWRPSSSVSCSQLAEGLRAVFI